MVNVLSATSEQLHRNFILLMLFECKRHHSDNLCTHFRTKRYPSSYNNYDHATVMHIMMGGNCVLSPHNHSI